MKPFIYSWASTDGIFILPILNFNWVYGWRNMRIEMAWLFWFVEIEWPIE